MGRKTKRPETVHRETVGDRAMAIVGPLAVILAGIVVYANSLGGPFLFDDLEGIVDNPSIRRLSALGDVFSPPRQTTVAGRPVANLTFAVNYAFGGVEPRGYHVANVLIHLCAGLLLFGVVRRTFESPSLRDVYGGAATGLATATALLWVVHPLQTESVTYVIQRVESLMGMFFLLTLYAAIRYAQHASVLWYVIAFSACALGMATKEVMVTVPVVVLLYDRAFLGGTFREALRRRWRLYAGLAATWVILGWLIASAPRSTTVGIALKGVTPLNYATTQLGVIVHYIRLSFWPHPLCLDYGWPLITPAREAVGPGLFVGVLLAATLWALVRRPAAGFLGAWFFLILAPTSSVVTIKDAAFEHRMYLPLAGVIVAVVFVAYNAIRQFVAGRRPPIYAALLLVVASALGVTTIVRQRDYQSDLRMWTDVAAKRPGNPRAHFGLGVATAALGRLDDAIGHYHDALALDPEDPFTHNNLAIVLADVGRNEEAILEYERALSLRPDHAKSYNNLGVLLGELGRLDEAIARFQTAIQLDASRSGVYGNLGNALSKAGRLEEAAAAYRSALDLEPESANAHNNLAGLLIQLGRAEEAPAHYETALRFAPTSTVIRTNYGDCLLRLGRKAAAAAQYRRVLAANPNDAKVRARLQKAMQD